VAPFVFDYRHSVISLCVRGVTLDKFWLCFVPLFVAVDALGTVPIFLGMTAGLERERVRRVLLQSTLTAAVVALSFLALGTAVLRFMGITMADFMVAGGILLFAMAMADLLNSPHIHAAAAPENFGAVPLGVPLIAGPALMTTSLLLLDQHGIWPTAAAVVANITIAGVLFLGSNSIFKFLGKTGARTLSKVANLLLAAIAVMIIRKGFVMIVANALTGKGG
jgi:multiple antibiotic resistance protein